LNFLTFENKIIYFNFFFFKKIRNEKIFQGQRKKLKEDLKEKFKLVKQIGNNYFNKNLIILNLNSFWISLEIFTW
jgi:hypothetical protein